MPGSITRLKRWIGRKSLMASLLLGLYLAVLLMAMAVSRADGGEVNTILPLWWMREQLAAFGTPSSVAMLVRGSDGLAGAVCAAVDCADSAGHPRGRSGLRADQ